MKKTASFAVLHVITAFTVTWAMTGSVLVGGAVALVEPAVNTVVYFFHEKVWQRRTVTDDRVRSIAVGDNPTIAHAVYIP